MIVSRKGLFAIAFVVDVALQRDGLPISFKTLAKQHGLYSRQLEPVLRLLVRNGILKGIRGPRGGYCLAGDGRVTANDIVRAAGADAFPGEEPKSELIANVVLPLISAVEEECGQALGRISLDDMVNRAATNGNATRATEQSERRL
jgi:Rrf2 family protein